MKYRYPFFSRKRLISELEAALFKPNQNPRILILSKGNPDQRSRLDLSLSLSPNRKFVPSFLIPRPSSPSYNSAVSRSAPGLVFRKLHSKRCFRRSRLEIPPNRTIPVRRPKSS